MKKLTLFFILLSPVAFSNPSDSLMMANWISKARQLMNEDANEGKKYLDTLRVFLDRNPTYAFQEAEYHKFLAIYYYRKSLYDSSLLHYDLASTHYNLVGNKLEQAKILVNVSMIHNRVGDYPAAIDHASSALSLFELLNDKKGISVSLNIIGQVYFYNDDYKQALKYMKQYLNVAIDAGDSVEIASGYGNIGSAFSKLQVFDSSIYYFRKGLRLQMLINNKYGIGNAYQNLANDFKAQNKIDSALYYYGRASVYYLELNNKSGLAEVHHNLGVTYSQTGNLNKSTDNLLRALDLAREINEQYLQKESLLQLSRNFEKAGHIPEALEYYKQYDVISDSIVNENSRKFIDEIRTRYETEKKEQQIALQQSEIAEQYAQIRLNYTVILALGIIVILVVIIFVLLKNRLKRKQSLLLKEHELSIREAYVNASIQSQEAERKRFARDLHDGMGQMISSLRMTLGKIDSTSTMEERVSAVSSSEKLMNEMQKEIRAIAFNLMPQTLIQQGLIPAVKEMALRINSSGKIHIETNAYDVPDRLDEILEITLYRVIQEWVNNILKYAGASRIEIQLVGHENELILTIEDNGNGFERSKLESSEGNGWKNIQSRIKLIHGEVDVDTSPGRKGSSLLCRIPHERNQTNKAVEREVKNTH